MQAVAASVAWGLVVRVDKSADLLNCQFNLPTDIVVKRNGSKYLFLRPDLPSWIVTNSNGVAALKLCNGKRTIRDIIRISSKDLQRDTTDEIKSFFQEIISNANIFSPPHSYMHHSHKLRTVHLNMTNKCNLRCIYCYADERCDSGNTLLLEEYLNLIDSINKISKKAEIILTGGEPLLSPYSLDVAEYAKNKGNDVHLLSNGLPIDNQNVRHIAELFDLIKISLDGSKPEINDFHRGRGSFQKIMHSIELLLQHNAALQVSMTVTRKNIDDIAAMAAKFGSMLSFAPLFKAGRARKLDNLAITGKAYYNVLSSINGVNPLSCLCSSLERAKNQRILKCAIADAEISISHTGNVYPCHLLHLPQFLAGNIREQSLTSIYNNSLTLQSCKNLNVLNIKGCKKCDIRFICGGACPARAFYEKNKLDVSGDFCEYEKLAFINGLFELHDF